MRSPIPLDLGDRPHGLSGYVRGGCGCDVCKTAKRTSHRRWWDKQDKAEAYRRKALNRGYRQRTRPQAQECA